MIENSISLISVIIPSYNSAEYIRDGMDSVLSQTYQHFEIIIVDSSTDNTREMVKSYIDRYPDKIRYFYQPPSGVSAARNKGITEAKGDYIAFLDADDLWVPEHLETAMSVFSKNPEISLTYGKLKVLKNNVEIGTKPTKPALKAEDFWFGCSLTTSSVVVKKECLTQVGLFDENLKISEDRDLWIRIFLDFKTQYIPQTLGFYRVVPGSLTKNSLNCRQSHIYLFKKHLFNSRVNIPLSLKKQRLAKEYYKLGKLKFAYLDIREARDNVFKAISISMSAGLIFKNTKNPLTKLIALLKPYFVLVYLSLLALFTRAKGSTKIKNILYLEGGTGFGGSSHSLYKLLKNINREKFNPLVVTFGAGPNTANIKELGIEVIEKMPNDPSRFKLFCKIHSFGFFYSIIPFAFYLVKVMKKKKIDLVHLNTGVASCIPALLAAKFLKIPCIAHMRGYGRYSDFETKFFKLVDKYICVADYIREILIKDYNIAAYKIRTVCNGLDLVNYKAAKEKGVLKKELNIEANLPVVGIVSRLMKAKGQDDFIRASKIVLDEFPGTKFLIVGDSPQNNGPIKTYLENLANELGVNKDIILLGWRKDTADILTSLDISVHASRLREGIPNVILESMAVGTPTIATKVGGCPELIESGQSGLLVNPGNPKELAQAIISLLNNPELARSIGENGKMRAFKLFDIRRVAKEVEATYEELLNKTTASN